MSNQFEWQTEDDAGWIEDEPIVDRSQTAVSSRRSWIFLFIAVAIVGGLGGGLYWQAQKQVSSASYQIEADIMASYELVQTAVSNQDDELFHSMLSARDLSWTETQDELMADGLLWNRPFFDAELLLYEPADSLVPILTISPDLRAAELTFEQPYQMMNNGVLQTVTLTQTAVYRRGRQKWLLSPPDADFWGSWETVDGDYLKVHYPLRDKAIATRLAADLDALIGEICTSLDGISCAQGRIAQLRFDINPASMVSMADPRPIMENQTPMELPTPTLVGLPVDEAAYRALLRAYGVQVATAVITDQVGYVCCQRVLVFRVLLEKQLHQLDLIAWLPEPIDYDQLLDGSLGENGLGRLWRRISLINIDKEELQQLYALVEYLDQNHLPDVTLAEMQSSLSRLSSLTTWGNKIIGVESNELFLTNWQEYIYAQSSAYVSSEPPIPMPSQYLMMGCFNNGTSNNGTYQYDLLQDKWLQPVLPSIEADNFSDIYSVNGSDQLYVAQNFSSSGLNEPFENEMIIYRQDQPIAAISYEVGNNRGVFVTHSDPSNRFLVVVTWSEENVTYQLVDLQDCDGLDCATTPVLGSLNWSSNGRYTLFADAVEAFKTQPSAFYLGDERGQPLQKIENGTNPFWIDETYYGYLTFPNQDQGVGKQELVVASVENILALPQQLIDADDLLALIPEDERPNQLILNLFSPFSPQASIDRQQLLIAARTSEGQSITPYYFLLTLQNDGKQVDNIVMLLPPKEGLFPVVSPNGRWLVWREPRPSGIVYEATLVNVETGESEMFQMSGFSISWSPDGNWLAYMLENRFVLRVPGTDYKKLIFHSFADCWNMQWVDN